MTSLPQPWSSTRQAALARATFVALVATVAAAVLALVLPGRAAAVAGGVMVAVLVGTPLVRVAWLGSRWLRRGDMRFALVAAGLLAIVAVGAAIAILRR